MEQWRSLILGVGNWQVQSRRYPVPFTIHMLVVDPTGIEEFRLRQYDRSRFGYQCPQTLESYNEEENDNGGDERSENDDNNRSLQLTVVAIVASDKITATRPDYAESDEDESN